MDKDDENFVLWCLKWSFIAITLTVLCISLFSCASRFYDVWSLRKQGEAELAKAESTRQIKTLEARALLESSRHLAEAEIVRARGVAAANEIIGKSLEGNESYLRYLWIQGLSETKGQVVYVPTEANLPILEASRLK